MTQKIRGQVDGWRYLDVRCDECGTPMQPVDSEIAEDGSWSNLQADGGLLVELHGYYGGFADQLPSDGKWQVLMCRECAGRLLASFGSLRRLVHRPISEHGECP